MSDDNWENVTFNDYYEHPEIQLMDNLELNEFYLDNHNNSEKKESESESELESELESESELELEQDEIIKSLTSNVESLLAEVERDEDIEFFLYELESYPHIKLGEIMDFSLSIVDFIMNNTIPCDDDHDDHYNYDHYNYDHYNDHYNYETM